MSKDSETPPPGGHFLVYQTEGGKLKIDVRFEGETVTGGKNIERRTPNIERRSKEKICLAEAVRHLKKSINPIVN